MWRGTMLLLIAVPAFCQTLRIGNAAALTPGTYFAPGTMVVAFSDLVSGGPTSARLQLRTFESGHVLPLTTLKVQDSRLWAVVPYDAPLGPATFSLNSQDGVEESDVVIVASAAGIFTAGGGDSGPAQAQIYRQGLGPTQNSLTKPALPGDLLTLWLTGLGEFETSAVAVEVGGQVVAPVFAGHAPNQPGLDQVTFALPAGIPLGCYVPVKVRVGDTLTSPATISTALSTGACRHPQGLSADQLLALDRGGFVLSGSFLLVDSEPEPWYQPLRSESASVQFHWAQASDFWVPMHNDGTTSCSWVRLGGAGVSIGVVGFSRNAGAALTVSGPNAKSLSLPSLGEGYYSKEIDVTTSAAAPFIEPGTWTLSVPGGPQIGGFQTAAKIPGPVHLTNLDSVQSFSRANDLELYWDPSGFTDGDAIGAFLQTWDFKSPPLGLDTLGIDCTATARSGRLVIPSAMLSYLPPDASGERGTIQLSVLPNPQHPNIYAAPLVSGGTFPFISGYRSHQWVHVAIR